MVIVGQVKKAATFFGTRSDGRQIAGEALGGMRAGMAHSVAGGAR